MSKWLRWYRGTAEKAVFRVIGNTISLPPCAVAGIWTILLEDAADDDHRGVAVRGRDYWAEAAGIHDTVMHEVLNQFERYEMVTRGDGGVTLVNFKKYQYESDLSGAERQSRYRKSLKERNMRDSGTPSPVTRYVTPQKQRQNTDTEKEGRGPSINGKAVSLALTRPPGEQPFDRAKKKEVWQQKVLTYLRSKLTQDRVVAIQVAYADGEAWAKAEFNRADKEMRANGH